MKQHCIAVCGLKRSGKDTIASYILSRWNDYQHIKIAFQLKKVIQDLFHFTPEMLETDVKDQVHPEWKVTPRQIMQFVGTDMFQFKIQEILPSLGRKFWITSAMELSRKNEYHKIVISDLRFPHEVETIKKYYENVLIVKVERPVMDLTDSHISELEYTQIHEDVKIINDGSLMDLFHQVDKTILIQK